MPVKNRRGGLKKAAVVFLISVACLLYAEDDSSTLDKAWDDFTSAGKTAVQEAGDFFSEAGKKVGEELSEAGQEQEKERSVYGKWKYDGGKTVTTINIEEDGTMEVSQRQGMTTSFWRGTCDVSGSSISFKYTETGTREFLSEKTEVSSGRWKIRYSFAEDGIMFYSGDIPKDSSGNGFSDGRLFE